MIDYGKIALAVDMYSEAGYQYIDVPWIVKKKSIEVTSPANVRKFKTFAGFLVASGEQSFLEMQKDLKPGRYQCVTPCFRDESVDDLHRQYFVKNELISVLDNAQNWEEELSYMKEQVLKFFGEFGEPEFESTEFGWDLMMNGIEVGSYGFRICKDFHWIYGTGCAEPRLSQAVS